MYADNYLYRDKFSDCDLRNMESGGDVLPTASEIEKNSLKVYLKNSVGTGSFGQVRYCTAVVEHEPVGFAVKIIDKHSQSYVLNRWIVDREVSVLKKIKHPNLITFIKVVNCQHFVFMYMEYCKNGDMGQLIKKNGPYAETAARVLFAQIVAAVEYLHGLDVAHRDLKPANILINHRDQVKVTDFGLANFCRYDNRRVLLYTRCGSRGYMPPEVLNDTADGYNAMFFDIWSMGAVLHYMLVGLNAFDVERRTVWQQVFNGDIVLFNPPLKHSQHHEVSAPAKRLIRRMLEPDVLKRARIGVIKRSMWMTMTA